VHSARRCPRGKARIMAVGHALAVVAEPAINTLLVGRPSLSGAPRPHLPKPPLHKPACLSSRGKRDSAGFERCCPRLDFLVVTNLSVARMRPSSGHTAKEHTRRSPRSTAVSRMPSFQADRCRRAIFVCPKCPDVAIAQIVGHHEDDVRPVSARCITCGQQPAPARQQRWVKTK